MSVFSDLVLTHSPLLYARFGESSGAVANDASGNDNHGAYVGSPTLSVAGATLDGDTAVELSGTGQYVTFPYDAALDGLSAVTFIVFASTVSASTNRFLITKYVDSSNYILLQLTTANKLQFIIRAGGNSSTVVTDAAVDLSTIGMVAAKFNGSQLWLNIDGVDVKAVVDSIPAALPSGSAPLLFGTDYAGQPNMWPGVLDEGIVIPAFLSESDLADIYAAASVGPTDSILPMRLYSYMTSPAVDLPMRLSTPVLAPAASLPMNLESAEPSHYLAAEARWRPQVVLNGVDISGRITGAISISAAEDANTLCTLAFIPLAGPLDPEDFERKPLRASFVGQSQGGVDQYSVRLFTGVVSTASHDPDMGIVSVEGTTDMPGWLENVERDVIDDVVGGYHSPHVFDDSADGYQYAKDRLSTVQSEMHIDNYGHFVVVPWAAKVVPDVTLTDSGRFNGTLRIVRASRRDLITRVRIKLDFRFARLRHREITAKLVDSLGLCSHLNYNWRLPSRDMVRSVFDGTEWTRISGITFVELPSTPQANICGGTNWNPGVNNAAAALCLGASARMARRWVQTVTEEYTLDVVATDLEQAIGPQMVNEDYGIEATYDSGDYERIRSFSEAPAGSTYSAETKDWQKDATGAEYDGRIAMQDLQECALAKAKATIRGRARGNRAHVACVFRPDITLASTVRLDTPGLTVKGKVAAIEQTLNVDTGDLEMKLELALSRQGGSGLASDDPLTPAAEPSDPAETPTDRTYAVGYRLGGLITSPPDDETWDGYMCNPQESLRDVGAPVYRERFVMHMPKIEETARNAASVIQAQEYVVTVPEDELTMSN